MGAGVSWEGGAICTRGLGSMEEGVRRPLDFAVSSCPIHLVRVQAAPLRSHPVITAYLRCTANEGSVGAHCASRQDIYTCGADPLNEPFLILRADRWIYCVHFARIPMRLIPT